MKTYQKGLMVLALTMTAFSAAPAMADDDNEANYRESNSFTQRLGVSRAPALECVDDNGPVPGERPKSAQYTGLFNEFLICLRQHNAALQADELQRVIDDFLPEWKPV